MTTHTVTKIKLRRLPRWLLIYSLVVLLAIVIIFPFYWMLVSSVKPEPELYQRKPTLFPEVFTSYHYTRLFRHTNFARYFLNSTIVASISASLAIVLAAPAAFSLGRLRYRGRKIASQMVVVFYLFPGVLLLVPLYLLIASLKLTDTLLALVLVYTSFQAPYATMLLRAYFLGIPKELEEAAMVDGASRMRILLTIILPLARPGLLAAWIRSFILSWSEFIFASLLITSDGNKTIAIGLYEWMGTYHIDWGAMTAGAVLTTIPVLVFFFLVGRTLVTGLLGGAIKG